MSCVSCMQARKPVLYVGGGCLDASAELREFVQRTGVPVAATLMGLGAFPEDHELALQVGALALAPCAGPAVATWSCSIEKSEVAADMLHSVVVQHQTWHPGSG